MLSKSGEKVTTTASILTTGKIIFRAPKLEFSGSTVESTTIRPPDHHKTYADSVTTVYLFLLTIEESESYSP